MHPDLLRALARARHNDLLDTHPSRGQPKVRLSGPPPLFSRARHRLGALLIRAGARLTGDQRAALDLAHDQA
jgi:hypothetical protein